MNYLTDYQPPGDKQSDLEELETLLKKVEVLIREKSPRSALREQALIRLLEASILAKECIKGRDIDPTRTRHGSYIIE